MAMELNMRWRSALSAVAGTSAVFFTVACGTGDGSGVAAQTMAASQAGVPVIVSCEPHQRTLVRPVVVNGATVSQVECVASAPTGAYPVNQMAVPVAQSGAVYPVSVSRPVSDGLADAQIVPAQYPATVARPVRTRQVVVDERPVRQTRSVKKSAIIIGSSAGVGAGVGAAVGGKKGALIGAAIGGGGAAVWDQITRRK
jgi:hypothetical protein